MKDICQEPKFISAKVFQKCSDPVLSQVSSAIRKTVTSSHMVLVPLGLKGAVCSPVQRPAVPDTEVKVQEAPFVFPPTR